MISPLNLVEQGDGTVIGHSNDEYTLHVRGDAPGYTNAQIDDYSGATGDFHWSPPLTLTLEARFSGAETAEWDGTAGFGFWNAPFGGGKRWPRLPSAIWFFHGGMSNNMAFAAGVAGRGWKAATIHAHSPWGYGLAPFGPLGALLMQSRAGYARLWPWIQARLGIRERVLPSSICDEWQRYTIEWETRRVVFRVANKSSELGFDVAIPGPLGFIAWVDNQYLVATPQGRFSWGTRRLQEIQRLELRGINIEVDSRSQ